MATLTSPIIDDLITNVRNMLNQPSASNSFWTDEELSVYLNEAVRRYFMECVQNNEGLFTAQDDLDIVGGTDTVALPTDFFKIVAVYKKLSNGYAMMDYRPNLTRGYSSTGTAGGDSYVPTYYLRGNNLVLRDVPSQSETDGLRIEYVQFPTTMITGGDTMTTQVSAVFRDLIEAYAVYKAKLKESMTNGTNTYAAAKENLGDLWNAFKEVIPQRSINPVYVIAFNPED